MDVRAYIFAMVVGYLLGSIPFALVIGKVFYKTDIREHGSGNLGATNAGRVLGKLWITASWMFKATIDAVLLSLSKVKAILAVYADWACYICCLKAENQWNLV